jgi:hypothetical protein
VLQTGWMSASSFFLCCRNWDAYGLMPHQEVCGANGVIRIQGGNACVSPCTYVPEVEPVNLICGIKDAVDLATVKPGFPAATGGIGEYGELYAWCSLYFRAVLHARL